MTGRRTPPPVVINDVEIEEHTRRGIEAESITLTSAFISLVKGNVGPGCLA